MITQDECSDPPALSCGDADCPVHGWDYSELDDFVTDTDG